MYKLMMKKVPYDIPNQFTGMNLITKGEYKKIPKKNEGGIYSDELINLIHLMMDLVFYYYYYYYFNYNNIILGFIKTSNH
jgi:hypothetical protein